MKRFIGLKIGFQICMHLLFWVAVYFFYIYFLGYGSINTSYINKFSIFLMPVTILVSYFFYFFLIPNYLLQKKQNLFILYSVYAFIVSFFFIVFSILSGLVFSEALITENYRPITKGFIFIILGVYFMVFIAISIGLVIHNFKTTIKNEDLKNKFLQTKLELKDQELRFLKMQIHPHFLFNSLNTIYGFAITKADEAPEMILKLSNLLDYILYQVEKPKVLLVEEVNHLEDYISLEKMRFHDTLKVSFTKENLNDHLQIPPMLLIPFVENSFKHGFAVNGILKVDIYLKIDANFLFFEIENSSKEKEDINAGIGLENIKKRLEMLYPKKHELEIIDKKDAFKVSLKIEF